MEMFVILLFAAVLVSCIVGGLPIIFALLAGYLIFFSYGLIRKVGAARLFKMSLSGILTIKNILMTFVLIGMLTALWRAAGTIGVIVCFTVDFIEPSVFVLTAFLLNSLISFLTGTSFGTAATMGVICMTMARTMGVSPVFAGGAALSGAFFGDRCSPVSTSALLVAELTSTDIFENIGKMLRSGAVPFVLTCLVYGLLGVLAPASQSSGLNVRELFSQAFRLGWIPLLPALVILALSLFRIPVKRTMTASILTAAAVCLLYQKMELSELPRLLLWGYRSADPQVGEMMNGGGIFSMVNVAAIVCLSSSYEGIFEETGLLVRLKGRIAAFGEKTSRFNAVLWTAVISSMVACNQTLATMLTNELCGEAEKDRGQLAIDLENSVIVVAPLVPWCIAGVAPLSSMSAPTLCLAAACYLYFIPLWQLAMQRGR